MRVVVVDGRELLIFEVPPRPYVNKTKVIERGFGVAVNINIE